jgi:signal transduction histidine kinase
VDERPSDGTDTIIRSEPERARRTLSGGVLLFRWVALTWMTLLNLLSPQPLRRPLLAWVGITAAAVWTVALTVAGRERRAEETVLVLGFDLALSAGLILLSGLVMPAGSISSGTRLFYATAYPLSTSLLWGSARGVRGAIEATVVLGAAIVLTRPINGISLGDLGSGQVLSLANGIVNLLLAGGVAGLVTRHLDRSMVELRAAIDTAVRSREHAARLAQHKTLARAIHDSVLQGLAFINKRGRQLAEDEPIRGAEVLKLAEIASQQEQDLRALIIREPEDAPPGTASLREALEQTRRHVTEVPVTVSVAGAMWLPATTVDQLIGAVQQALANVVEHAGATRAAVFAEMDDGWVTLSVRDDGRGFVYSQEQLRAEGKVGMLESMRGRIEDMGGRMRVQTAPGAGTEVEFRIPVAGTGSP